MHFIRNNLRFYTLTNTPPPPPPPQCLIHASLNRDSIVSDNGLSPIRRQAIIWTNAELLPIGPLGTNCSEISINIKKISFAKMHLKILSAKLRPFCPGGRWVKWTTILIPGFWTIKPYWPNFPVDMSHPMGPVIPVHANWLLYVP